MALSATFKASLSATQTRILDLVTGSGPFNPSYSATFADGAGANQANLIWSDTRTLAASGVDEIDLTATVGSPAVALTDLYGQAVSFARIKGILILPAAANTNNVLLGRGSSNGCVLFVAASDAIAIRPGGMFLWVDPSAAGIAVANGSTDILTVTNSAAGTPVTYSIVIVGASS